MEKLFFTLAISFFLSSCGLFLQKTGLKNYSPKEKVTQKGLNDYQYDFIYLSNLIDEGFPLIDSVFPETNRELQAQEILSRLEGASDNSDFLLLTRKYLSNLKNQHTSISLNQNFKEVYPFIIYNTYDNWYLLNISKQFDSLHIGKKITKINGVSTNQVESRLIDFTFSENKINQQHEIISLQLYNKQKYLKEIGIVKDAELITLTFEDNSFITLSSVKTGSKIELFDISFKVNDVTKYVKDTYFYKLYPEQQFGYLQFNRCHDKIDILEGMDSYVKPWLQPFARCYLKMQFKKEKPSKRIVTYYNPQHPIFKNFIWELIDSLNINNIDNLIIDLRNNPGGNLTLGVQLMYFLIDKETLKGFNEYAFTSDIYKAYFPKEYKKIQQKYPNGVPKNRLVLSEQNNNLFQEITDSNSVYFVPNSRPIFNGNIYILSNYGTGSAAAMLTTLFQDNRIGTIIGTSVGNNPIGATTYTPMKLPKTNANISVASTYIIRPDETKGKIQIPDIWVEYSINDLLNGNDPYLEIVRKLVKNKTS